MSLITEVRDRADSAVRGRTEMVVGTAKLTFNLAGNVINGAAGDVRDRLGAVSDSASTNATEVAAKIANAATTLVDRSVQQARKQALATVGAGDFFVEALTKRAEELPLEVSRNAGRGAATASALARSARAQAATTAATVRAQGEKVVDTARKAELPEIPDVPAVRGAFDARVGAVRETAQTRYDQLAERGEYVVRSVRRSPRVLDAVTGADHVAEDLADELSSVAGKVRYRAGANVRSVRAQKAAATRAARSAGPTGAQKATAAAGHAGEVTVATARNVPAKAARRAAAKAATSPSAPSTTRAPRTPRSTAPRPTAAAKASADKPSADKASARKRSARTITSGTVTAPKASTARTSAKAAAGKASASPPAARTTPAKAARKTTGRAAARTSAVRKTTAKATA
jgi:hypothetical protein